MSNEETKLKLAQFDEFFSIEHQFSINISPINPDNMPSFEQFVQQMPLPFKIASDIMNIDQAALKPLQGISSVAGQLIDYLHHQTKKIDLLVGYIISQQDEEDKRFKGIQFGGGGLIFSTEQSFTLGQMLSIKMFLLDNTCAVYCLGEVIEVSPSRLNDGEHQYKVVFHFIRENDREVLVRTSLHEQSKQLHALAQERNKEKN